MANSTSAYGFQSFGHLDGSAPTMGLERLILNTSDTNLYFTGDVVARSTAGAVAKLTDTTTSAQVPIGIFAGCEFFSPTIARNIWSPFYPGSVGSSAPGNAYVITDPEMKFKVRTNGIIGQSAVGQNAIPLSSFSSLGNTATGISAVLLSTVVTGTASAWFKIVALYSEYGPPGADGTDNTTAGNIVVVTANSWERRAGTVGAST